MILLALALSACTPPTDSDKPADSGTLVDADGDGYLSSVDCDDAHATINPDAPELCNGLDDDCDGAVDEDATDALTWYTDGDGDGFGAGTGTLACDGTGATVDGDCDDTRDDVYPGAAEPDCTDPVDHNCDGSVAYEDADGDGAAACADCDDGDPTVAPGETEVCDGVDDDCDGDVDGDAVDAPTWYVDHDGDGWSAGADAVTACEAPVGYVSVTGDCDDFDAVSHPGATEVCDAYATDEDCDGVSEDADTSVSVASESTWYADRDGDGFGDSTRPVSACAAPTGYVDNADDCDDADADTHPDALEVCGGGDEDCDGLTDDDDPTVTGTSAWYGDADGDGYGGTGTVYACALPTGASTTSTDCDDTSAAIHPGATEVCGGGDEDCDGLTDDADPSVTGTSTWYVDGDGDGYGGSSSTRKCVAPSGATSTSTDCDDTSAAVHPGATEVCGGGDEDCDGLTDDDDPSATGKSTWYKDADGDGYAGSATTTLACDAPSGYYASATDCDDTKSSVHALSAWYTDGDGDGYGIGAATMSCSAVAGAATLDGDCDDTNSGLNPGATEVCDAADHDEDCDSLADDADSSATGKTTAWLDSDGDGWGGTSSVTRCNLPAGYVTASGDCDDAAAGTWPGATEVCEDGIDQDCDGSDETCVLVQYSGAADLDSDALARIDGNGGSFGYAMAAGDFNGDGLGDVVVGAWGETWTGTKASTIYGFYGMTPIGETTAHASYDFGVYCDTTACASGLGLALETVGDLDDDGRDDFGGYLASSSSVFQGVVFKGGDTSMLGYTTARDAYTSTPTYADGGNFDEGTTTHDLIGGDSYYTGGYGVVYVYPGFGTAVQETIVGATYADKAGCSVGGGHDIDGDGQDDLLAGAYGHNSSAGAAYLVYAPLGATSTTFSYADVTLSGTSAGDYFGSTVAMVDDLDGDGHDDLIVAAPRADDTGTDAGVLYLFADPTTGYASSVAIGAIRGAAAGDYLEDFSTGDVDGDGTVDLLAGAYTHTSSASGTGAAWLVYGPLSGSVTLGATSDAEFDGPLAHDSAGSAVAIVPDMDGDGNDELAIAGYQADMGSWSDYGALWIWKGH